MSNSWRQYGGLRKQDQMHNLTIGTLVADQVLLREKYSGSLNFTSSITVNADVVTAGNNICQGNIFSNNDTNVGRDLFVNDKIFVGLPNLLKDVNISLTNYSPLIFNNDILNYINIGYPYLSGNGLGIGINEVNPTSAFEIRGTTNKRTLTTQSDILTVTSPNTTNRSIIAQNVNYKGIVVTATDTTSYIDFYNDISTNKLNTTPKTKIQNTYSSIGNISKLSFSSDNIALDTSYNIFINPAGGLYINSKNDVSMNSNGNTYIYSNNDISLNSIGNTNFISGNTNIISNGNIKLQSNNLISILSNNIVFSKTPITTNTNSKITIKDLSSVFYLYDYYENRNVNVGNSITSIAVDNSSCTSINLITENSQGFKVVGGCYANDSSRSIGSYGLTDICGNYLPISTIISGTNTIYYRSTMGINTFAPKTDNYSMDVNGALRIGNGEITLQMDVSFEIVNMMFARNASTNRCGIAVGTSSSISSPYNQFTAYTKNNGKTWNLSTIAYQTGDNILQIQNAKMSLYVYDNSFSIIGTKSNFIYFTINGGQSWSKVNNSIPERDVTSIFICNLPGGQSQQQRVYLYYTDTNSNKNIQYFDLSYATTATTAFSPTIGIALSNITNSISTMDGTNNFIYAAGTGIQKYSISSSLTLSSGYPKNTTQTYNNIYVYNDTNAIAVGNNIISYTTDGVTWNNISSISGLTSSTYTLNQVYIYNLNNAVAVGNNGIFIYSLNWSSTQPVWQLVPNNILNSSGVGNLISNSTSLLKCVSMYDVNTISICRTVTNYNISTTFGESKMYSLFLPNLFNRTGNNVLDICGNMTITGDINIIGDGILNYGKIISNTSDFYLLNENVQTIYFGGNTGNIFLGNLISSRTTIAGDASFNNRLFLASDLSMGGRLIVRQTSNLVGDVSLNNRLFVSGDVSLNSRLFVVGDVSMNSRLFVSSDVSMNSRLFVAGDVSMNSRLFVAGDVSMNSRLFVSGDVSLNNRMFVSGDVSLNNRLFVTGDVSLNNRLFVTGDVSFSNRLYLSGDASLNNRLFVTGDVSFNNRLFVLGDVSLNNRLYLAGDASLNSRLYLAGDASLNSRLFVTGDVSLNSRLFVTGDVSLNSRLFVSGDVSLNNRLYVTGDVSMSNRLYVISDTSLNSNLYVNKSIVSNNNVTINSGGLSVNGGITLASTPNISSTSGNISINPGTGNSLRVAGNLLVEGSFNIIGGINQTNILINVTEEIDISSSGVLTNDSSIKVSQFGAGTIAQFIHGNSSGIQGNVMVIGNTGNTPGVAIGLGVRSANYPLDVSGVAYVSGDVSLNSRLFVTNDILTRGNVTIYKTSILIGDASLNSRLSVAGDASFNSRLFVASDVSLNNNLVIGKNMILNGDASLNSKLYIAGDASLNNRLFVANDVSFNNNLSIGRNITLIGDASFNSRLYIGGDASLNSRLFVSSDVSLNSNLVIGKNMILNGDASLNSRLYVAGDVSFNSRLFVASDVSLNSNLVIGKNMILNGDASLNSRLSVAGDASLNSRLYVASDVSLNSNLVIGKNMILNGDASFNSRLYIGGDASFNSRLFVSSDVSLNSNLVIGKNMILNGDASLNSRLSIAGDVSFNSRLFVASDVSLNSNLVIGKNMILNGDASLNSRLSVAGDASLNSRLYVASDVSLNNNLVIGKNMTLNGDASLNSRLSVAGDASLNSRLFVSSDVSLNNNLSVGKDTSLNNVTIYGNLTLTKDLSLSANLNAITQDNSDYSNRVATTRYVHDYVTYINSSGAPTFNNPTINQPLITGTCTFTNSDGYINSNGNLIITPGYTTATSNYVNINGVLVMMNSSPIFQF